MNLVELEIENYRQFLGDHRFTPGEQSLTAIIGRNGAGKTTLFEAIEWCLYNPSHIRNDDIRNRIHAGRPRVCVTLEDPVLGERYQVERELRGKTVSAAIYLASQPGAPVVQGTRQVSEFVSQNLLGLSHKAFVATFFTRQKELTFFGGLRPAERRRDVGGLLGLETIRIAQESIGVHRLEKQQEANTKRAYYEEQSGSTDFVAERSRLMEDIEERKRGLAGANCALDSARTQHEQARQDVAHEQARSQEHARLLVATATLNGTIRECEAQIASARATLEQIDQAEAQLGVLLVVAEQAESLTRAVETHVREEQRTAARDALTRQRNDLAATRERIAASVREVSRVIEPDAYAGEGIREQAPNFLVRRIVHLRTVTTQVDLTSAQAFVEQVAACREADRRVQEATQLHARYLEAQESIRKELRQISESGDPRDAIAQATSERTRLASEKASAAATIDRLSAQKDALAKLRSRLRSGQFDDACPTCGRPFQSGEVESYVNALSAQLEPIEQEITKLAEARANAETGELAAARREEAARSAVQAMQTLQGRIAQSEPVIAEADTQMQQCVAALHEQLRLLKRDATPDEVELVSARTRFTFAQQVAAQIPRLDQLSRDLQQIDQSLESIAGKLVEFDDIAYDRERHVADNQRLTEAREATAQVAVFRRQIAGRQAVETAKAAAEQRSREVCIELEAVSHSITVLNFLPESLEQATLRETERHQAFNEAVARRHEAESALATAHNGLASLDAWEARLTHIRDESIAAQRESDELDRMYKEFTRFEQHMALLITPALAELTSQMVSAVTDGKYDRIEFTEDFGIDVFDGAEDRFPLSQFSGGERDVIALCARLALSQFIGGQARMPLQFVVLDEVFGSLDRERRENLMTTLQRLVDESAAFRQLFVISHVDDVRASSAFDEIWRVVEDTDGISRLETVTDQSLPEDL